MSSNIKNSKSVKNKLNRTRNDLLSERQLQYKRFLRFKGSVFDDSYIVKNYRFKNIYYILSSLPNKERYPTLRFLAYLIKSTDNYFLNKGKNKHTFTMPKFSIKSDLLNYYFNGNLNLKYLRDKHIIVIDSYIPKIKCRTFKLDIFFYLSSFVVVNKMDFTNYEDFNLFSGRKVSIVKDNIINNFVPKILTYEKFRLKLNFDLVDKFLKKLNPGLMSLISIEDMKNLDNEINLIRLKYKNDGISTLTLFDFFIKINLLKSKITTEELDKAKSSYIPHYFSQKSGRIYDTNGFQNSRRIIKQLLTVKSGILNYDIKHSQVVFLKSLFKEFNMEYDKIDIVVNKLKKIFLRNGIPKKLFKSCLYSIIQGFNIGIVNSFFVKSCLNNPNKETLDEISKIAKPLKEDIKLLIKKIIKSKNWNINKCNMQFDETFIKKDNKIVSIDTDIHSSKIYRKLLAHHLLGMEAAFVHTLTNLCAKKGIIICSNEFDGLTTENKIPKILVEKAAKKLGILTPDLRIKPFCKKSEIEAFCKRHNCTSFISIYEKELKKLGRKE